MKKVLLFFIALFVINSLLANQVDTLIAKQVAVNFYNTKTNAPVQKNLGDFVLVYKATSLQKAGSSVHLYYIYNAGDAGFVIVAADDHVKPVLGYSTEGSFNVDIIPPATAEWLYAYEREIQYVIDHEIAATT